MRYYFLLPSFQKEKDQHQIIYFKVSRYRVSTSYRSINLTGTPIFCNVNCQINLYLHSAGESAWHYGKIIIPIKKLPIRDIDTMENKNGNVLHEKIRPYIPISKHPIYRHWPTYLHSYFRMVGQQDRIPGSSEVKKTKERKEEKRKREAELPRGKKWSPGRTAMKNWEAVKIRGELHRGGR